MVQAMRMHDGAVVWSFPAPSRMRQAGSVKGGAVSIDQAGAGFVHVRLWDDTVLLLDDHRTFYRLRLDTGEIAWQYASAGAAMRPLGAGTFCSHFLPVGDRVLVQDASGRPVWLGDKSTPAGEPSRPWFQAPCIVDDRILMAGEAGSIHGYDVKSPQRPIW